MGNETSDTQQLAKKVKLFEAIINRTQDGILVFSHQFEVMFANNTAGDILGLTPAKLRGKSLNDFIPKDARSKHGKLVDLFNASSETKQELYDWRSIKCCKGDGSEFPAKITIDKFSISGSMVFIVSLIDMTDTAKIEQEKGYAEINHFLAEQQKKYSATTLHHNFENSINKIAKTAQTIKENFDIKLIKESMSGIMNYSFIALSLSQRAIYISESLNSKSLTLIDKSLHGSFERIQNILEDAARAKQIKLIWDIPKVTKNFKIKQPQTIEQIFYNIIEDAIENAIGGEITIQMTQRKKEPENDLNIEFQCKNQRFGISQQVMDRVLNAASNHDIPTNNNLKLNGMRLRLAKQLIEQNKGKLRVISHPIEGTVVFVTIQLPILGETIEPEKNKEADFKNETKQDKVSSLKKDKISPKDDMKQKVLAMRKKAS